MRSPWYLFLVVLLAKFSGIQGGQQFKDVLMAEVSQAAKLYFSRNSIPDDSGFNTINVDDDWSAVQLFERQYGENATTARFVAAILDFEYFKPENYSFSDVVQFILTGEHQDARKALAAHSLMLVQDYYDNDFVIDDANVTQARATINAAFKSTYDSVGNSNFASFLNLKVGSSLSFVIDTTRSMKGEIDAAKTSVMKITDKTKGTPNAPLNYVLVPFNDPTYGPVTKTSDSSEFIGAVNSLSASGGGDFPELAMIAILKAVENSGSRSIVYVYTDAPEKDTTLQNHVIALCLVKKISVYIFLSSDISRRKRSLPTGRILYDNIAKLTGGSVMLIKKADIESATAVMEATTVQGSVMLVSKGNTNATSVTVHVDPSVSSLTVQLAGSFNYMGYTADGSFPLGKNAVHQGPFEFYSYNFPSHTMSVNSKNEMFITTGSGTRFFIVSPGLNGVPGTVSFESETNRHHYLQHNGFLMWIASYENSDQHLEEATYWPRESLFYPTYTVYESYNYPNYYIRHEGYRLKISREDNTELLHKDASFIASRDANPGVKLFRLDRVSPGVHTFHFDGTIPNEYGVQIRGRSTLGFHSFLSQRKRGTDAFVASRQLQAGQETRAEMTVYGDAENVEMIFFELISRDGRVLVEIPLGKESDTLYTSLIDFDLPKETMIVKLTGLYKGMRIERIDPCAITPTLSESILEDINNVIVRAGNSLQVTTTLHNKGANDDFIIHATDNRGFVTIEGADLNGHNFTLRNDDQQAITLKIAVPTGAGNGDLSKVLISATGVTDNYFLFTTFVVSVIDDVKRCPSLPTPGGGSLICNSDGRTAGSVCRLQCGHEFLLKGADSIVCQADGTWVPRAIGICRHIPSRTCVVAGDPHYRTFDNRRYNFMGSCLYTLLETLPGQPGITPVSIATENGLFYGHRHVSYFKQAFLTINGTTTITMRKGRIILIDGVRATLPVSLNGGKIVIKRTRHHVVLQTDFKMFVVMNHQHFFSVKLPVSYAGKIKGLCGNYDFDRRNDLMFEGVSYRAAPSFGNSQQIAGGSNRWCRKAQLEDDDLDCDNAAIRAMYAERCASLKSNCFQNCADAEELEDLFRECIYDMCAMDGNRKILETHLANYASSCSDKGIEICNWRRAFGFPNPPCGKDMHYQFKANRCPNTCVEPQASQRCESKPKSEGCVCNPGFLLEGERCIRHSDCGCAVRGRYYPNGVSLIQTGCTERCSCNRGVWACKTFSCEDDRECTVSTSGVRECQLKRIDQCYATGDPHYQTLDGSRYDFMGTCRYVMLSTNGKVFADADRHITITAQNEHRDGITRVAYVRAVYVDIRDFQIKLGPGVAVQVMKSGTVLEMDTEFSADDGIFSASIIGREARCRTKFGITVKFDGMNLYIDVPSYYINKVAGLCGNYTGVSGDDFGGKAIKDFAADHIYGDGCAEDDVTEFVCSDEDKAKWGGAEFCGKLKAADGPFQYCIGEVNVDAAFENCVFDACATDGDAIREAIQAYAQECNDKGEEELLQCDWQTVLGVEPDCPQFSSYDGCASPCVATCRNPFASDRCESLETAGRCVCELGYVMHEGQCVNETSCGCVVGDEYVEQGFTKMEGECAVSKSCVSSGNLEVKLDPCSEGYKCKELEPSNFACVYHELAHALIFGAAHYKTFDGKFFDFYGTCSYLLVGYDSDQINIPTFKVFVRNKLASGGKLQIENVVVDVSERTGMRRINVNRDKRASIDDTRYAFGSTVGSVTINQKRDNTVLDFAFGLSVHFNGEDWVRVDISDGFVGKLHGIAGNYNGDVDDDNSTHEMTSEKFDEMWRSEGLSSDECSEAAPTIDVPCAMRQRYERSCDCGMITDPMGPFAICHLEMDPNPFMISCVTEACLNDGSVRAIGKSMKAYYVACLGKGVHVDNWREHAGIEMECPMHSHYDSCTDLCQPSCRDPTPVCPAAVCEEGCACDEGFIMSDGECVTQDDCGCSAKDGSYYKHGDCRSNEYCSEECTCVHGEWNCEATSCNDQQTCGVLDGKWGCHWKDLCKYENGGCSDFCNNGQCSCEPGRILTLDSQTCVDISPTFFAGGEDCSCDSAFGDWKAKFFEWQHSYLPGLQKELEAYKQYVHTEIFSMGQDVCQYSWTEWYDRDDPSGSGDDEILELLRAEYPEICEKPIASEGRMTDGRKIGAAVANFEVTRNGLICKNAKQKRGATCPDFAVRFMCRAPKEMDDGSRCD